MRKLVHSRLVLAGFLLAALFLVMAAFPWLFTRQDPYKIDVAQQLLRPSAERWFGSDRTGRDIYARVIYGSRISLGVAVGSITVALLVGGTLGLFAGYFGGLADQVLGRIMDVLFSFPAMLFGVAVTGILGPGVRNAVIAIAVVFTPVFFRVVRAPVLVEKERDYVEAARAVGVRRGRIMWRHLLPNIAHPVIVQASVALSFAIILEAALSYLGLGTQPPHPSWGTILNEGRAFLQTAPWISIFPGLAIFLSVFSLNLVGDGLRDLLDPRLRGTD